MREVRVDDTWHRFAWMVYALVCPVSGATVYIGKTVDPDKRLWQHIHAMNAGSDNNLYEWMRNIRDDYKLEPRMEPIHWGIDGDGSIEEAMAIRVAIDSGDMLLNSVMHDQLSSETLGSLQAKAVSGALKAIATRPGRTLGEWVRDERNGIGSKHGDVHRAIMVILSRARTMTTRQVAQELIGDSEDKSLYYTRERLREIRKRGLVKKFYPNGARGGPCGTWAIVPPKHEDTPVRVGPFELLTRTQGAIIVTIEQVADSVYVPIRVIRNEALLDDGILFVSAAFADASGISDGELQETFVAHKRLKSLDIILRSNRRRPVMHFQ